MQRHSCLLIAEDFWQKPDALIQCSQEFYVKAPVTLKFLSPPTAQYCA